jgi:beta-lactamase class A
MYRWLFSRCYIGKMRVAFLVILTTASAVAQSALQRQILAIASDAHGRVSVACSLPGTKLNCDLDPHAHPPMQSVFKLPLTITVLHAVEQGKFSLDQPIRFLPEDRIPHTYSPLQDKYPNANVDIPLRELIRLSVSESDNGATDVLMRILGGSKAVDGYIASIGITGFHIENGEDTLQLGDNQYRNWWEPASAVALLRRLADDPPLTPAHTALLLGWMRSSPTGQRLRLKLPPGTAVAHKSGSSFLDAGLAHATNDIGLIALPDGRLLAVAVFVTDSTADAATRERVIARIGRAAYDAAIGAP